MRGIIVGLGSTPGALIVGLLVSFAALALELLWSAVVGPKIIEPFIWQQNTSWR